MDFGTQDQPTYATHIGICQLLPSEYAVAFWGPSFQYTILSLGYLHRHGWNYRTSGTRLIITDPSGNVIDTPTLSKSNMLPVTRPISQLSSLCLATPSTQLSAAFISKLDAAEALHHQFNHPSDQVLAAAITNGSISTTVTPKDILNNRKHRGPCMSCSMGKLRDSPHPPSPYPPSPRPGHTLVLDINEIKDKSVGGNSVSIHCVDTYSTRYDVLGSPTKTIRDVFMAIVNIVATGYNAFRRLVEIIYTDSEAVFRALQALLGSIGIQLLLANPIDHNRFFERYKQTLGMRFYSTLASLPYHLPPAYYLQLAADTAYKHNCLPNSKTGNSCPWTIVTGKTPFRPKGIFGGVYMITSSIQQRTYLAKKLKLPTKSIPKACEGVNLGKNPLWPSADQFVILNKEIVSRVPRSSRLDRIPFGWTPKPITSISNPNPAASGLPFSSKSLPTALPSILPPTQLPAHLPSNPSAQSPPSSLNSPIQSAPLPLLQNILDPPSKPSQPPTLTDVPTSRDFATEPSEDFPDQDSEVESQYSLENEDSDDDLDDQDTVSLTSATALPAPPALSLQPPHEDPPPASNAPLPLQPTNPSPKPSIKSTMTTRSASRNLSVSFLPDSSALATPLTAVSRKALLKRQSMAEANAYKKVVNPLGITNSFSDCDLDDVELDPPTIFPDEIPLRQALKLADQPSTDPKVKQQIKEAIDLEVTKLFETYDTLRELTSSNPKEPNALDVYSTAFVKFKRDGRVTARIALCGNGQTPDSYDDIYASTSDHSSWVAIFAAYYAAAINNGTLDSLGHHDFDLKAAFLHNRLPRSATGNRQLILTLPSCLPHRLAGKQVEVVGAMYGAKQSNHIFEQDYAATLASIGVLPAHEPQHGLRSAPDTSVYHLHNLNDPSLNLAIVMQVDDGQLFSTCPLLTELVRSTLIKRYGPISWNQVSPQFGGTTITHFPSGAFKLDLSDHIHKMLHKLGADNIPPALTPCSSAILRPSTDLTPVNPRQYQSLIGNLIYTKCVRHELTFPVTQLAKHNHSPTKGHQRQVIRILRYLKGFPDIAPYYYTTEGPVLCAHIDAAFANQPNGISTSCLKLTIGSTSAPFLSKTFDQDLVALDPASSEYFSMSVDICKLILRFRNLLAAIGFPQVNPTPVYIDNQPAIDIATAHNLPRKSRYFLPRTHFIRECVADGLLIPIHKNTNQHIADLGTKPHDPAIFHQLTRLTMNSDAPTEVPSPTTPAFLNVTND